MGEIDIYLKNFIKIDSVFAQLFNQGVFGGKCLIDPDKLQEQDSVSQETVKIAKDQLKSLERLRDVQKIAKVFDEQIKFQIILGVENQSGINYYMPVRCMELDALSYTYQCRKISSNMVKFSDIAGTDEEKEELKEICRWSSKRNKDYSCSNTCILLWK